MTSSPAETRPPGGQPPPAEATLPDGTRLELRPLAQEIARRFRREFPDEVERYGDAGLEWCVHDNLYLLSWAALDLSPVTEGILDDQLGWLRRVLAARGYPVERIGRDLELAAEVVEERVGPAAAPLADRLRVAAAR